MAEERSLFTSESVTEGHPDKVADRISDAVLDAALAEDPESRVACETLVTTGLVVLAGEITTQAYVDFRRIVEECLTAIGYTDAGVGLSASDAAVIASIDPQSLDIAQGVDPGGAGDQGLMFGYACRETEELMPLPISLAHALTRRLAEVRKGGERRLRPDGKSQVTIEYDGDRPARIDTVVVSTQHSEDIGNDDLAELVREEIIKPVLPPDLTDGDLEVLVNPTGRFVVGGPKGDCGLTGRKIIVDTYGGMAPHGGGAFSGKDPTKVDRSATYMARYVAKNLVASGVADRVTLQLAYAIGRPDPVSVRVDSHGTGKVDDRRLERVVRELFALTPGEIIKLLDLKRPIYQPTAAYGHFGREEESFSWERTDRADAIAAAV